MLYTKDFEMLNSRYGYEKSIQEDLDEIVALVSLGMRDVDDYRLNEKEMNYVLTQLRKEEA